jgi:hypothetical protein
MTMARIPETPFLPVSKPVADRMDLTVNEVTQHVHQHAAEPRDIDYRVQAFNFALSVLGRHSKVFTSTETIEVAVKIENYLRDGA